MLLAPMCRCHQTSSSVKRHVSHQRRWHRYCHIVTVYDDLVEMSRLFSCYLWQLTWLVCFLQVVDLSCGSRSSQVRDVCGVCDDVLSFVLAGVRGRISSCHHDCDVDGVERAWSLAAWHGRLQLSEGWWASFFDGLQGCAGVGQLRITSRRLGLVVSLLGGFEGSGHRISRVRIFLYGRRAGFSSVYEVCRGCLGRSSEESKKPYSRVLVILGHPHTRRSSRRRLGSQRRAVCCAICRDVLLGDESVVISLMSLLFQGLLHVQSVGLGAEKRLLDQRPAPRGEGVASSQISSASESDMGSFTGRARVDTCCATPTALPRWSHQAADRWSDEVEHRCSVCFRILGRVAHERNVSARRNLGAHWGPRQQRFFRSQRRRSVDPWVLSVCG